MSRTQKAEKPPRLEYTGQTEGGISYAPNRVQDVTPGVVIAPDDAEHADLLLATGHFVETTRRATKPTTPDAEGETPETPAQPGDAAQEPE
ncbi:hypothetical protein [Deinococcus yunweiensis]|uniref:hypothetical protein n=1 Tax=Deinococcus yunweiensis TaxID=367282 RepID=UPI00398EA93E